MAVSSAHVTVADTAVALNTASVSGQHLILKNKGTAAVHLGASDVTTTTGLELVVDDPLSVDLSPGEVLFAIGDATGDDVHVLRTGA